MFYLLDREVFLYGVLVLHEAMSFVAGGIGSSAQDAVRRSQEEDEKRVVPMTVTMENLHRSVEEPRRKVSRLIRKPKLRPDQPEEIERVKNILLARHSYGAQSSSGTVSRIQGARAISTVPSRSVHAAYLGDSSLTDLASSPQRRVKSTLLPSKSSKQPSRPDALSEKSFETRRKDRDKRGDEYDQHDVLLGTEKPSEESFEEKSTEEAALDTVPDEVHTTSPSLGAEFLIRKGVEPMRTSDTPQHDISVQPTKQSKTSRFLPSKALLTRIKHEVRRIFDDDAVSPQSFWNRTLFLGSIFMIIMSTVVLLLESTPQYYMAASQGQPPWHQLECFLVAYFLVELSVRVWATPHRLRFFTHSMWNIIDLFAILPSLIGYLLSHWSLLFRFPLFRALRVLRVIRAMRHIPGLHIIFLAISHSRSLLFLALLQLFSLALFFSLLLFHTECQYSVFDSERQAWLRPNGSSPGLDCYVLSPFQSAFHSLWWSLATLLTVGYGDELPISSPGKLLSLIAMIVGVVLLAIPSSIISFNFIQLYERKSESVPTPRLGNLPSLEVKGENSATESNTQKSADAVNLNGASQEDVRSREGGCSRLHAPTVEEEVISLLHTLMEQRFISPSKFVSFLTLLCDNRSHGDIITTYLASQLTNKDPNSQVRVSGISQNGVSNVLQSINTSNSEKNLIGKRIRSQSTCSNTPKSSLHFLRGANELLYHIESRAP